MNIKLMGFFILLFFTGGYFLNIQLNNRQADVGDKFVVGIVSGYLPFVGLDGNGNYEGFDIDVAQHIAERMNKKLILKDCGSMGSLFVSLHQNLVDSIMWGLSITQSRLEKIAMVRYYGDDICSYALVFWDQSFPLINSLDDCTDKIISVEAGSVQEKMLDSYPLIKKLSVDRVDDALLNIQYGKTDGALVESIIAKKFKILFPDRIAIVQVPLKESECEFGFGIGINKNNTILVNAIKNAIKSLEQDGTMNQLKEKWDLL